MKILYCPLFLIILTASSPAAIIDVPSNYPTIQMAIDSAGAADTIYVGPGTYTENIDFRGKGVKVLSVKGADSTTILAASKVIPVVQFVSSEPASCQLSGFTFTGSMDTNFVDIRNGARPQISRNIFNDCIRNYGTGNNLISVYSKAEIAYNLFSYDYYYFMKCVALASDSAIVRNNTFYACYNGVLVVSEGAIVINNLFDNCSASIRGNLSGIARFDHNDLWNSPAEDTTSIVPGPGNIALAPKYQDSVYARYRLKYVSPCRDAGDPDSIYNDPDGTRNDIGALPVNDASGIKPLAFDLHLGVPDEWHVVTLTPTFYWHTYSPAGPQSSFWIEVNSTPTWTTPDMWVRALPYPDTSAVYAGAPLQNAKTYYYRVRLASGAALGDWRYGSFRKNSVPPAPDLSAPDTGAVLRFDKVAMTAFSHSDPDGDPLTYFFNVYDDASCSHLVSQTQTPGPAFTISAAMPPLAEGKTYWWRVQTYDGFEYSQFSAVRKFYTRSGPGPMTVPAQFRTIQAAMTASYPGDTIYLQPGIDSGSFTAGNVPVSLLALGSIEQTIVQSGTGLFHGPGEIRGITFQSFRIETNDTITVKDCKFINGSYTASFNKGEFTLQGGGAVNIRSGSPKFIKCQFINNAEHMGWHFDPYTMETIYYHGGGGAVNAETYYPQANPIFDSCLFVGNSAEYGGAYGGEFSKPTFTNCIFLHNSSTGKGGAIKTRKAIVDHCTFFADSSSLGSHIYLYDSLIMSNSIFAFGKGGAAFVGTSRNAISYSDIFGNEGGDWTDSIAGQAQINHNQSLDPLFCNPAHDVVTLAGNSPCYHTGFGGSNIGAFGVGCDVPTDVATPPAAKPYSYELKQNAPNPFNPATKIDYSLERSSHVTLTIYNILGQKVAVLVDDFQSAGWHEIIWDGRDNAGNAVASGIYLYLLKTDDYQASRQMILIK